MASFGERFIAGCKIGIEAMYSSGLPRKIGKKILITAEKWEKNTLKAETKAAKAAAKNV